MRVTAVSHPTIGVIVACISFCAIVLSQNYSALGQQQPAGNVFQIDNVTFSHHTATVNGIQIHYVIGGTW